jgi:hypothetical protein
MTSPYDPPKATVTDASGETGFCMSEMNRVAYWSIVLGSALVAMYFFFWAIQTAWLGSFPGRDVDLYSRWTYIQAGVSLLAVLVGVLVGIRGRRKRKA